MIVAPTPTFFGSNPAEAALSGVASLRPLSGVEDIARELVRSMSEEQKSRAVLSSMAPSDILTVNQPFVAESSERHERVARNDAPYEAVRFTQAPRGLAAGALNESQRQTLRALIREYIDRMPDAIAEVETARLERMGIDTIHIAWAGGLERRQPHYYRLHSPRFLVEYDNTQNDANHIHSVWRDPVNDFGADLIAHHYRTSHGHG
jgi:hypothetical protein